MVSLRCTFSIINLNYKISRNYSHPDVIFNTISHIVTGIDKIKVVCAIYFDINKAFDTINHPLTLNKHQSIGIRGTSIDVFPLNRLLENNYFH